ncbi:hypothetical protein [Kistimonas asteriae]|uniref:hypothetical protein n=1 Tax=Kistimonas asteriae TaxID=517724 RepID=UPI001BAB7EA7|nr:hypothetical protein [Kistimonas asteriae]
MHLIKLTDHYDETVTVNLLTITYISNPYRPHGDNQERKGSVIYFSDGSDLPVNESVAEINVIISNHSSMAAGQTVNSEKLYTS